MRALVMRGHGDLSRLALAEVPQPTIATPDDVLIHLEAAALNRLDLWTLRGLPGVASTFPHILGGDGAGVVEEVGVNVRRVKPGDRVMFNPGVSCYRCEFCHAGEQSLCETYKLLGEHLPGTLAEYVRVPWQNVRLIPTLPHPHGELTWAEAAAFSLVTLTAWRMLVTKAQIRPGERVLIWGIGGGVSGTAMRIAKLAGAYVIATSSSDAKLEQARKLGADAVLNHNDVDVVREVRALTDKRGVNVVIENIGESTWERSLRLLGRGGRLVTCGATTGPKGVTDIRRVFWHQFTIIGSTMGTAAEYDAVVRLLGQGHLRPIVDSIHPLEDGVEAFRRLREGSQMGKIVVEIA
jgi:NADPH:quinone reductase-like Zn-dependent oxidoreductase